MAHVGSLGCLNLSVGALISLNFDLFAECFLLVSTAKQVISWQNLGAGWLSKPSYFKVVNWCWSPIREFSVIDELKDCTGHGVFRRDTEPAAPADLGQMNVAFLQQPKVIDFEAPDYIDKALTLQWR